MKFLGRCAQGMLATCTMFSLGIGSLGLTTIGYFTPIVSHADPSDPSASPSSASSAAKPAVSPDVYDKLIVAPKNLNLPADWVLYPDATGAVRKKYDDLHEDFTNISLRPDSCKVHDALSPQSLSLNLQILASALSGTQAQLVTNPDRSKAVALALTPGLYPAFSVGVREAPTYFPQCANVDVQADSKTYGRVTAHVDTSLIPVPRIPTAIRELGLRVVIHATTTRPVEEIHTNKVDSVLKIYSVLDRKVWVTAVEGCPIGQEATVPDLDPIFIKQVAAVEDAS